MKTKRNVQLPETRLRGMLADSFMRGQECERTSYEMSRAEAEAHANRFVDEYLKAGHIVPAPSLREALEAVEAEPELPGEMPEEMWDALEAMRGSVGEREAMTEAFRIVVQLTKKGIADRLRALATTEDQGGA